MSVHHIRRLDDDNDDDNDDGNGSSIHDSLHHNNGSVLPLYVFAMHRYILMPPLRAGGPAVILDAVLTDDAVHPACTVDHVSFERGADFRKGCCCIRGGSRCCNGNTYEAYRTTLPPFPPILVRSRRSVCCVCVQKSIRVRVC